MIASKSDSSIMDALENTNKQSDTYIGESYRSLITQNDNIKIRTMTIESIVPSCYTFVGNVHVE
jgi:hypothetical protein